METVKQSLLQKVVFIGGGMMAEAIIKGMLQAKTTKPSNVTVVEVTQSRCDYLIETYNIKAVRDAKSGLKDAKVVFLAIKPQVFLSSFKEEFSKVVSAESVVVSIMAGIDLEMLKSVLPVQLLIRVMPNTPLAVGEGMTVLSRGEGVNNEIANCILDIFKSSGDAIELPENMIDAASGLSGSGPGFIYVIIDALADAGVLAGLPRDIAIRLAAQTVCGTGRMVLETKKHPAELRDQVTSPGGTTIVGIAAMEKAGVRSGMIDAVVAAVEKTRSFKNR